MNKAQYELSALFQTNLRVIINKQKRLFVPKK